MRRLAAAAIVLLLSCPARAQSTSPAVLRLGGRLELHGRVESSSEQSCSQSYATMNDSIDLALDVTAAGVATLRVEAQTWRTFGDAQDRYTGGTPSLTQTLSRRTLTGRATRSATSLDVSFDHSDDAFARWAGPGMAVLSGTTPTTVRFEMHCALSDRPVLPAAAAAGEQPTTLSLLACRFDSPPGFVEHDETNEFLFGRDDGVRIVSEHDGFRPQGSTVVRLAE